MYSRQKSTIKCLQFAIINKILKKLLIKYFIVLIGDNQIGSVTKEEISLFQKFRNLLDEKKDEANKLKKIGTGAF